MLNNAWSVWFAHQRPWSSSKRMNFNDFSKRKTFSFHAYALCFTCILFDDVLNMKPRFFLLFSSLAKFGVSFNFDEEMWERQNTFFTWQRSHGRWMKKKGIGGGSLCAFILAGRNGNKQKASLCTSVVAMEPVRKPITPSYFIFS